MVQRLTGERIARDRLVVRVTRANMREVLVIVRYTDDAPHPPRHFREPCTRFGHKARSHGSYFCGAAVGRAIVDSNSAKMRRYSSVQEEGRVNP